MNVTCNDFGEKLLNTASYIENIQVCAGSTLALAIPTTLLNLALIIVILSSNERTEPCQMLVLNLAFTDFAAGLYCMPALFVRYFFIATLKNPCLFDNKLFEAGFVFAFASLFLVTAISIERYIHIFNPYNSYVTSRATAIGIVCIWVLSIVWLTTYWWIKLQFLWRWVNSFIFVASAAVIVFCYIKILVRARKIRRQVQTEAERYGQRGITGKERNLLLVGGFIIISLFSCYTFHFVTVVLKLVGIKSTIFKYTECWGMMLLLLNSLFNPMISCIFNRSIRQRVFKLKTLGCFQSS